MKQALLEIKSLLKHLDAAELRLIEDYAQYLRMNLQEEALKRMKTED